MVAALKHSCLINYMKTICTKHPKNKVAYICPTTLNQFCEECFKTSKDNTKEWKYAKTILEDAKSYIKARITALDAIKKSINPKITNAEEEIKKILGSLNLEEQFKKEHERKCNKITQELESTITMLQRKEIYKTEECMAKLQCNYTTQNLAVINIIVRSNIVNNVIKPVPNTISNAISSMMPNALLNTQPSMIPNPIPNKIPNIVPNNTLCTKPNLVPNMQSHTKISENSANPNALTQSKNRNEDKCSKQLYTDQETQIISENKRLKELESQHIHAKADKIKKEYGINRIEKEVQTEPNIRTSSTKDAGIQTIEHDDKTIYYMNKLESHNPVVREKCKQLPTFHLDFTSKRLKGLKITILDKPGNYIYHGYWNDKKVGIGSQVWPDGSYYEGYWENDEMHGNGRIVYADGNVYEGQFAMGQANGKGTFLGVNESKYEGDWLNDKQDGKGTETTADGDVYTGDFIEGEKNGTGVFKWKDGSEYNGQFKNNKIEGYGIYRWPDGKVYEGNWMNDRMNGQGQLTLPDKSIYKGNFKEDKMDGHGQLLFPNGKTYTGEWKEGKAILNDLPMNLPMNLPK